MTTLLLAQGQKKSPDGQMDRDRCRYPAGHHHSPCSGGLESPPPFPPPPRRELLEEISGIGIVVSVIYSLVLFLLGIIAVMKEMPNKFVVLGIAFVFLVFAFIYMLNIPMPTGFDQMNFFEFKQ